MAMIAAVVVGTVLAISSDILAAAGHGSRWPIVVFLGPAALLIPYHLLSGPILYVLYAAVLCIARFRPTKRFALLYEIPLLID